jgi:hypothetical protein
MDSEADCGNWWGFSQSGWWWKSKDYSLQSSLGRIRQERRHLGAHHASTGICYHGKIELSYISARYSTQGSSTTTGDQHTSTCRIPCSAQCVYSFVRLSDRDCSRLTCYLCCRGNQKYNHEWVLQQLREVWTKTFKSSSVAEDDVQEDDVEMTADVVRMWRQFHGWPASGDGIERVFFSAGKQHDALKKRTMDKTLESSLKTSINTTTTTLPTCDDNGVFTDDDDTYRKHK